MYCITNKNCIFWLNDNQNDTSGQGCGSGWSWPRSGSNFDLREKKTGPDFTRRSDTDPIIPQRLDPGHPVPQPRPKVCVLCIVQSKYAVFIGYTVHIKYMIFVYWEGNRCYIIYLWSGSYSFFSKIRPGSVIERLIYIK